MKKTFIALIVLFSFTAQLFANFNEEKCILEEYNGREAHTPLAGVDVKVKGSNWTTTDVHGNFTLSFRYIPEKITDFQFVKDGYVIFNKDAVNQWRPSKDGSSKFKIVLCKQKELRERIEQYWGIIITQRANQRN